MAALLVVSYDVSDPERFADYNPGSIPAIVGTIGKHGGELVSAGPPDVVMGEIESVVVCISFPDVDAAKAWLADDEYAPMKAIRHESTTNIREFVVPSLG